MACCFANRRTSNVVVLSSLFLLWFEILIVKEAIEAGMNEKGQEEREKGKKDRASKRTKPREQQGR